MALTKARVLEILNAQRELLIETVANGGDFSIDDIFDIITQAIESEEESHGID